MVHSLECVPYRRPFAEPLRTAHRTWIEREGILLRLIDQNGRMGFGEVAPVPEFGTETLEQAAAFLESLKGRFAADTLAQCPRALRCCRFALGTALRQLASDEWPSFRFANCALLPAGGSALEALVARRGEGFRVFKLKIGVGPVDDEGSLVQKLLEMLPPGSRLRLDANGSLTEDALQRWLPMLARNPAIEFLEQPLPPGQEEAMARIAGAGAASIALDESVASVDDLERMLRGGRWKGPLVLKASILGAPDEQLAALAATGARTVFSSVFETAIGLNAVLQTAARAGSPSAVGGGTLGFFTDPLGGFALSPELSSGEVTRDTLTHVWEAVCSDFVRR